MGEGTLDLPIVRSQVEQSVTTVAKEATGNETVIREKPTKVQKAGQLKQKVYLSG